MLAYSISKYYAVTRQRRRTRRCFPPCSRIRHSKKGKRLRRTFLMANTPPYGQPQNGQPQYNQPPQPQAPNYSQPQPGGPQYGQPQPPMPGNFPSQQAAPRPKISRRSPLSSARWPQSSSSRWQRCSSLRIVSAVPITRKRWSKRRRWKAAIQPSMRNSARRRAQRTTIHPPLMTRARRS